MSLNKKTRKNLIIASVTAVLVVGFALGLWFFVQYQSDQKTVEVQPVSYLSTSYWGDTTYSSGTAASDSTQEIYPSAEQTISDIYVTEGQQVSVGDPLLQYDKTKLELDVEAKDIAVLYVEDLDIEPVVLGDSDQLSVGDWAICIGNPLSFTGTTTVGVISALNREVTSSATDAYGKRAVNTMIQTDAAINAGNSGGGMFNVAGELIGIPSMKYTGSMFTGSTVEGIGMAIPINEAKDLINDVLSGNGNVEGSTSNSTQGSASISTGDKPRIGVTVSNLNPNSYAVANNLIPTGAYVQDVESGSPAEKAGVQVADIVVEVDGTRVSSMEEMTSILQSKQAGDTATLKVYRVEGGLDSYEDQTSIPDGEYIDLTVELAMLDAAAQ